MSAGLSSSPPEDDPSNLALEAQYVHLNTQLLQHLQQGHTLQALQVAESIQDLCVKTTATPSADPAATYGAALFSGSPAGLLLRMRSELSPTAGGPTNEARAVSTGKEIEEKEEGSESTTSADASLETSTSSLPNTANSSSGSSDDDQDEPSGRAATSIVFPALSVSSHPPNLSEPPPQHQQPFSVLAAALTRWSNMSPAAAAPTSSRGSEAAVGKQQAPMKQGAVSGPTPPPSRPPPQRPADRSRGGTTSPLPRPAMTGIGNTEERDGGAEVDEEADEAWKAMQQQVAKEMERLAVVRKHR